MQHLEGSGTPVLYIGRTVLKGLFSKPHCMEQKNITYPSELFCKKSLESA
jgi:hypothetical protein